MGLILAILLTPLILKLATRACHLGSGLLTRNSANKQNVEEDLASPVCHHRNPCPLEGPSMIFIPPKWFPKGPEGEKHRLNILRYCGQEYAAQQQADSTCQAFVRVMFPTPGDSMLADYQQDADPVELAAMVNDMDQYRIIRSAWTCSFSLLIHGDDRVYVPVSGRRALIQAAHAVMHEGMGSTNLLLEGDFYWPTLEEDTRQFTGACRALKARRAQRWRASLPATPLDEHQTPTVGRPPAQRPQPADAPETPAAGPKRPGKPKMEPQHAAGNGRRESGPSKKIGRTGYNRKKPRGNSDGAPQSHNAYPQAYPTVDREVTMAELEGRLAQLLPLARELEASIYEKVSQVKNYQLIAEGDVPTEENIVQQIVQQGRDLCESALSWKA